MGSPGTAHPDSQIWTKATHYTISMLSDYLHLDPKGRNNLANADRPDYDEGLLATINAKLNALIAAEIGDDRALYNLSTARGA
jgi:hypothetical protein